MIGAPNTRASSEVATSQLRVVAQAKSIGSVLADLRVTPSVLTPQGDGVNDILGIEYALFRVMGVASVEAEVFGLDGRRVWHSRTGKQAAGRHRLEWDGLDGTGHLVAPGLYLVRVGLDTDEGRVANVQPFAVAY